ncbi:MAG: response regulator [Candidatus Cloacimonetes bacterium]|nr:response regulator [Candidatus Cloacimonadota bacterium]MCF7815404.1 response regulator [Candidatus Cloacimonadota bacterium]MCF7884850.1 response regulator [Candidatus Cloacimonadota bacterium]
MKDKKQIPTILESDTKTPKIMVVDDEPINVMIAKKILEKNQYETITAASGAEALQKIEENPPDLILLDIMMPAMNGFEVCIKLQEDDVKKEIPVIFLTAVTDKESIVKGFEAGGKDYLTKPFNTPELLARVKAHVSLKLVSDKQKMLIEKLQKALHEIQTLSGLLPICSHCKKIRDDSGYWKGVEHYIAEHSDAQFSHGICPDCMRQYYPKVAEKVLKKQEEEFAKQKAEKEAESQVQICV